MMTALIHHHKQQNFNDTLKMKEKFASRVEVKIGYITTVVIDFSYRFHGVMVSTLDSESSDPSSNLGGT